MFVWVWIISWLLFPLHKWVFNVHPLREYSYGVDSWCFSRSSLLWNLSNELWLLMNCSDIQLYGAVAFANELQYEIACGKLWIETDLVYGSDMGRLECCTRFNSSLMPCANKLKNFWGYISCRAIGGDNKEICCLPSPNFQGLYLYY